MSTKTAIFTTTADWLCPDDVTAIFAMMVGAGAGASGAGNSSGFLGSSGGSGSGELMMGRPITVIPGQTYTFTVGTKGGGLTYARTFAGGFTQPTASSFADFHTLPGGYTVGQGPGNAGAGGGPRGSPGSSGGAGFDQLGYREANHFSGGAGGSFGSFYSGFHTASGGVQGGQRGFTGISVGGGGSGGAGGGTIFGGNTGGNSHTTAPDGTFYGSGAGGAGEPASGTINGGNGSNGYGVLMWADGRV